MMKRSQRHIGMIALVLGTTCGLLSISPRSAFALTFFVNQASGLDTRTCEQARQPDLPVATIAKAISCTADGDTVRVGPGVYAEMVDVKRSNTTLIASPALAVTIDPPTAQGILVSGLSGVTVEGFIVKGATTSIAFRDGADFGIIRGNVVYGSTNGIAVTNASSVLVENNIAHSNTGDGVSYVGGTGGTIHNNLSYNNGEFGIVVSAGTPDSFYLIQSNTSDANANGLRFDFSVPGGFGGGGDIVNNIVTNNNNLGIAVRNLTNVFEDYNSASGNGSGGTTDFDFGGSNQTRAGDHSNILAPGFVDPDGADNVRGGEFWQDDSYHLSQIAAGQAFTSLLVDTDAQDRAGNPIAVSGSTATDGLPDTSNGDPTDTGFHYQDLATTMTLTVTEVTSTISKKKEKTVAMYRIQGQYALGTGSGIDPLTERVKVDVNSFSQILTVGTCESKSNGKFFLCKGKAPGVMSLKIQPATSTTGSFDLLVRDAEIPQPSPDAPLAPNLRFRLFIGDEVGSAEIYYTRGTLTAP